MNRVFVAAGGLIVMMACACGTPEQVQRMEMEEDMEQTMGNERSMIAADGEGTNGFMGPNAEEQAEIATEPYPD